MKFLKLLTLLLFVGVIASCDKEDPLSTLKDISNFALSIDGVNADDITYDVSGTNINVSVPFGTDISSVVANLGLPAGAKVVPASGSTVSFKDGVAQQFVVTAEDGSTKTYNVTVSIRGEVGSGSKLTKVVYDESQLSGLIETYTYTYNDASLVASYVKAVGADEKTYTIAYDDKNQVTGVSATDLETTFTYDDNGMIVGRADKINGEDKFTYVYTYDDNGYLKESVRTDLKEEDASKATYTSTFTIDGGNTLTNKKGPYEFTGTFDDKMNPFVGIYPMAYGKILAGNDLFAVNKNNVLTRTGYDDPGVTYEYNDAGYPVSSSFRVFSFATIKTTYEYE